MQMFIGTILPVLLPIVIALVVILVLASGYVKSPPDQAYIISGLRKTKKILIGKAGVKIPFFERLDKLNLALIPIDVKTASEVPTADYINIRVDANVNIKVGKTPEALEKASTNFLNLPLSEIGRVSREVLEGNMREIVGLMKLEEMVSDRQKFAELVKENAAPDLAEMGLEIISFNVQNFEDKNGVIDNLGVDNIVRIQKTAAISRAESERDIAISKSKAAKEANDAKVAAAEQIADRNAQLEKRQADLKREVDTQKAIAEAAQAIEAEKQRQTKDVAATSADIARTEKETELKKQQIELKERELDALIRKQADADKYATEKKAEADLIRRQKEAEAKAYEIEQQAKAQRVKAEADRFAAEQQAAGIAAVGQAEATAIEKKAEAQKKMGEASIVELVMDALPKITASAAAPLEKVDKIVMYGEGNTTKMVSEVMKSTNQIMEGVKEATGLDITAMIASYMGSSAANKK